MGPRARENASKILPPSGGQPITQKDVQEAIENLDDLHSIMLIENLPEVASLIYDMKWGIVSPENPSDEFVTSDHPVSMLRPESIKKYGPDAIGSIPGLVYKDVEISLPLSPKLVLLMGWQIEDENQFYVPIASEFVEQMNLRTIIQSEEKLIASSEQKIREICLQVRDLKRRYPSEVNPA